MNRELKKITENNQDALRNDLCELCALKEELKKIDTNITVGEWTTKVYPQLDMKMILHRLKNDQQTVHSHFWREVYIMAFGICDSPRMDIDPANRHKATAKQRNDALIAEIDDLLIPCTKACEISAYMYN